MSEKKEIWVNLRAINQTLENVLENHSEYIHDLIKNNPPTPENVSLVSGMLKVIEDFSNFTMLNRELTNECNNCDKVECDIKDKSETLFMHKLLDTTEEEQKKINSLKAYTPSIITYDPAMRDIIEAVKLTGKPVQVQAKKIKKMNLSPEDFQKLVIDAVGEDAEITMGENGMMVGINNDNTKVEKLNELINKLGEQGIIEFEEIENPNEELLNKMLNGLKEKLDPDGSITEMIKKYSNKNFDKKEEEDKTMYH